jgi:membrane associated rhomboid family serine protease
MRQTPFDTRRSATMVLLIVLGVVFLLQEALLRFTSFPVIRYFALSLWGLAHGYVWQLLTYQFMHAGLLHLFFNCWAIYVFGHDVEMALGRKSFLTLYFSSGILGGLCQALAELALGGQFSATIPVVGASAAAFGLAAAFAMLFPNRVLLLFFVLPMRAKWLLALGGALALYGMFSPFDGTAHAAHLGGLLTGLFFIRYAVHWHWPGLGRLRQWSSRRLVRVPSDKGRLWRCSKELPPEDLPPDEFLSREVDPILDKISAHGIQSLTHRERRILEAARARMAKR